MKNVIGRGCGRRRNGGAIQPRLIAILAAVGLLAWALYGVQPEAPSESSGIGSPKDEIVPIARRPMDAAEPSTPSSAIHEAARETGGTAPPEHVASIENDTIADAPPAAGLIRNKAEEMREGDWARVIISSLEADEGNTTLDDIYRNAQTFTDQGKSVDAYLLNFYAARQGHAASAMVLAGIADPGYFTPDNGMLDEPDPAAAIKWYTVAAKAGEKEAEARLEQLKQHLDQQAKAGDRKAQRLLLQWQ